MDCIEPGRMPAAPGYHGGVGIAPLPAPQAPQVTEPPPPPPPP
jgi:hypothetical protein